MKKKLLIGTVNMEVGGIEKTLIGLLNEIDYSKYDVDLLLLKTNGTFIKEINANVNIITPYKNNLMKTIANSSNFFLKIIKHLSFNYLTGGLWTNKKNYDVAISYSGYYPFIDKLIAKSNAKKKLIWVHTDLKIVYDNDKFYRQRIKITKNKYKYFDNIICVSDSVRKEFINFFSDIDPKKVLVQWNIINIIDNKDKYPKLKGDIKLVSVGRLCYSKRFDKLICIHKKLIDNGYNAITYVIGDGEEKLRLKKLIKDNNIEKTFILLGFQKNVINIVKQADIFVSTSDYEGLPTVLLESLHAGVPFIAPKVKGITDIANFIAPKNSYILTNNNIDDLYKGVKQAIKNNYKNTFDFQIEDYNKKCIESFYKIIK